MTVALPARAKLNLDLRVTGRRPDGLHELRTHMQAIDLHDLLEAEPASETELVMSGLPVANDKPNTVLAAHAAVELVVGRRLPTRFRLHKRIPPGSGLGGASSDAVAALRALIALHRIGVDIASIAARVGSDASFFLCGGGALVESVGEKLTRVPVQQAWYVIAWPGIELSTAQVYRTWDEVGGDGPNELRRAAARVDPRIDAFASSLGKGWQMTGSGSAFFSACPDRKRAEAMAKKLDCWTAVAQAEPSWA